MKKLLYFFLLNISFLAATPSNLIPYIQEVISEFSELYNCVQHIETDEACAAIRALQDECAQKLENILKPLPLCYNIPEQTRMTSQALSLLSNNFLPIKIKNIRLDAAVEKAVYTFSSLLLKAGAFFDLGDARNILRIPYSADLVFNVNGSSNGRRNNKVLLLILEEHALTIAKNIVGNPRTHGLNKEQLAKEVAYQHAIHEQIAYQLLRCFFKQRSRYASLYDLENQLPHIPSFTNLASVMHSRASVRNSERKIYPLPSQLLQQLDEDMAESAFYYNYTHVEHSWPGRIIAAAYEYKEVDETNFFDVDLQNTITLAGAFGPIEDELLNHPEISRKRVKALLIAFSRPIVSQSSAIKMFELLLRKHPKALQYFTEHRDQILTDITLYQDTYPVFRVEDIVKATEYIIAPVGSSIRRFFGYSRI